MVSYAILLEIEKLKAVQSHPILGSGQRDI